MTIGIAVRGPGAGAAILTALARLESVGDGAIGGFVSLAAMAPDGSIHRADTQCGGGDALLARLGPGPILDARLAVIMSSGPDRPEPLAQFTPARPGVGLVTGHRFPNALGRDGKPLAEAALDLLEAGYSPDAAAQAVAANNPRADAGVILLGADARIGLANTALVGRHRDKGSALVQTDTHAVGVLHNSIEPHALIAPLAVHFVTQALSHAGDSLPSLHVAAGVPVRHAATCSRVMIDRSGKATALEIATDYNGDTSWSAGLGPEAEIVRENQVVGRATTDPYLLIRDGHLTSVNGLAAIDLHYRAY